MNEPVWLTAQNHAFVDGNKRTELYAADLFLEQNGYRLDADQKELEDIMVDLAEKQVNRIGMADFLEKNSYPNLHKEDRNDG